MRRLLLCLAALLSLAIVTPSASAANDLTPYQWALRQIHAQEAWQVSTGAGITVGVVDTGADAGHPDFGGRVSTVDCTNTGGSSANCGGDGSDINGHGTHVSGIIAAASDGSGTAGAAPSTRVLVARVFACDDGASRCDDPSASVNDIDAAVDWLISQGAAAINLSLGDFGFVGIGALCNNSRFEPLLNRIWARGAVGVFAAGNCGRGIAGGIAPRNANALIVGATGPSGQDTSYTNDMSGAKWALDAPGGDGICNEDGENCVLSTWPGGGYYLLQGTSMAAPHVTGAVAALLAKGFSRDSAVAQIMNTLDPMPGCGSGCDGRLNLQRALGAPDLGSPPPPPPPGGGGFGGSGGTVKAPPTTRRPATARATAPSPAATPETTAAPTTTTEAPTTTTEAPTPASPQALRARPKNEDDGLPALPVILGVVGLLTAAGATGLAQWRRARGGGGL